MIRTVILVVTIIVILNFHTVSSLLINDVFSDTLKWFMCHRREIKAEASTERLGLVFSISTDSAFREAALKWYSMNKSFKMQLFIWIILKK